MVNASLAVHRGRGLRFSSWHQFAKFQDIEEREKKTSEGMK
jgi:hypothetical protein